jgi:uncharacterized protein involved in exopolysaccharide biosynthesis
MVPETAGAARIVLAYKQTFRQTWRLFLLPLLAAGVMGGWFTFGQPKTYRSVADLWIVTGTSSAYTTAPNLTQVAGSPAAAAALEQPSVVEQAVINELLTTNTFNLAVGDHSSLRAYLATDPRQGFSPTALLSKSSREPLPYRVATTVGAGVRSQLLGPDSLQVSFTGPSPATAQSGLRSLLAQLRTSQRQLAGRYDKAESDMYQTRVAAAQAKVANAQASLTAYEHAHPSVADSGDTIYQALERQLQSTTSQLAAATDDLSQTTAAISSGNGGATLRVISAPTLPLASLQGLGDQLLGVVLGLGAGTVLMLVAVLCMTPGRPEPWDSELWIGHRRRA